MRRLRSISVVGVLLVVAGCGPGGQAESHPPASAVAAPAATTPPAAVPTVAASSTAQHSVRYEVSGAAKTANIAYGIDGTISQPGDQPLPWSHTETPSRSPLQMVLVLNADADATITCQLWVDGRKVDEHTAQGGGHVRCAQE